MILKKSDLQNKIKLKKKWTIANYTRPIKVGENFVWVVWILAILLLLCAGMTYRAASHLKHIVETPIRLPIFLSAFPTRIGNWVGSDLPIPSTTKEYMEENFADDFLSRQYVNTTSNTWANVYVVYCSSRPSGILGHQPLVCYPAHGWIHDGTEPSLFTSQTGRQVRCLIHRFHKLAPAYEQMVVLNFYILNGQITTKEKDFSGPLGRRPNIAGDPARYVAQVQISSVLENSTMAAANDVTDLILDFLPGKDGKVKAVEYTNIMSSVLK